MLDSSYKRFFYFFKCDRQYTILDPWNYNNPGARGVAAGKKLTYSQLKNYQEKGDYGGQSVVFGN
jgi:hypothetical protein